MKKETAALLEKHHNAKRLQFVSTDIGLEPVHDLSDEEKLGIVTAEYGNSLSASLDDLFVAIIRKYAALALERAKYELSDKLSVL